VKPWNFDIDEAERILRDAEAVVSELLPKYHLFW
jgi:hypothetical protein